MSTPSDHDLVVAALYNAHDVAQAAAEYARDLPGAQRGDGQKAYTAALAIAKAVLMPKGVVND